MLRIWPLYYLYFSIALLVLYLFNIPYPKASIPFYIFLAANIPYIISKTIPFLAHYWSLGVEEQFYLFFPQLAKLRNSALLRLSVFLIGVMFSLKVLFWWLEKSRGISLPYTAISITSFHNMLIGVAGAILYFNRNQAFMRFTTHTITQIVNWVCFFLIIINKFHFASLIDKRSFL